MVDIEKPLLDYDLNREIKVLEKEYENFIRNLDQTDWKLITDLRDIDRIQSLMNYVSLIQDNIKNLNSHIKFIVNSSIERVIQVKNISQTVYCKLEELYLKLNKLIDSAINKITNEISINKKMYLEDDVSDYNETQKIIIHKIKLDNDKLNLKKDELEKLVKIIQDIFEMAKEIKNSIYRQNIIIPNLTEDSYLYTNRSNLYNKDNMIKGNNLYFSVCACMSSVLVIFVIYLYIKIYE